MPYTSFISLKVFSLFTFIFILFFSSAVGLYNSMDSPQFFTTESILNLGDLDISYYSNHPLFFGDPDIFYKNNQTYGIRGFLLSILTIPIHLISRIVSPYYTLLWFDPFLRTINDFSYTLAVTSLLPIFSIVGLYFLWKTISDICDKWSATITTLILAFGTYIWKYSNAYTRQSASVAILGIGLYLFHSIYTKKEFKYVFSFTLLVILAYGIDPILFISLLPSFCISVYYFINKKHLTSINTFALAIPCLFFLSIIGINKHFYDSYASIQTMQQPIIKDTFGEKAKNVWLSTPLYPTINCVFFCAGKIPTESFRNFSHFPEQIKTFASLSFAQDYNFYGIFTVTPAFFLIFSLMFFTLSRYVKILLGIIFLTVGIGIVINTKTLIFWGGNQYDIRYFTPYTLLLGFPLALFFYESRNLPYKFAKKIFISSGILLGIFSVYMGWLGILHMYLPAQTGEQRIYLEPSSALLTILQTKPAVLFYLTFMNFSNLPIALALISCSIFIFISIKFMMLYYLLRIRKA